MRKLTKKDKESSFRNKMFELLEKTNERVHLDRPFLIREKMQVILLDSEKQTPTQDKAEIAAKQRRFVE